MADIQRSTEVGVTPPNVLDATSHHHDILTTTEPTAAHHRGLDLHTILPIACVFLLVLILVLCLRYHIYSSSYKQWLKRLRPRSRSEEEESEPVDMEMFKPPPEYETAVNMPKPCDSCRKKQCGGEAQSNEVHDEDDGYCLCNTPEPRGETNPASETQCSYKTETETVADSSSENRVENSGTINRPETCTVQLYLESDGYENCERSGSGPFMILEHVQRMAHDPNVPSHFLPSYQDYIKEFPDDNDCV